MEHCQWWYLAQAIVGFKMVNGTVLAAITTRLAQMEPASSLCLTSP
jgi:hypothetical protein